MKRKLDDTNTPVPVPLLDATPTAASFQATGLDTRLLQATVKEGFRAPTAVQSKQTFKTVTCLTAFCSKEIRAVDLTQKIPESVQRSTLSTSPEIVISTPGRAARHINTTALSLDGISILAIDEADLVLSYGYEEDLQNVANALPSGVQTLLMSATLTPEVDTLKNLYCRNPAVVDVDNHASDDTGVTQYVVQCAEDEKFLLAFVIFKLKLIKGKCITFVADIDRCYRLKLFLEQFGVKACVLNSELPVNSRCHVVEEFNKSVYDIIIASDENEILGDEQGGKNPGSRYSSKTNAFQEGKGHTSKRIPGGNDDGREYGISRGIDFKNVACVLNFDLPTSSKSYTHRIGRTARAGRTGMALSLVVPSSQYHKHKPTSIPSAQHDESVLAKIIQHQGKKGKEVKPYDFDMKQIDAFRYRVNDALRAVTSVAVREARTRELRQEILNSEKLKRHFEENPEDLQQLRHDGELRPARVQAHLKHVPDYLMPNNRKQGLSPGDIGFVGFHKTSENRIRRARMQKRMSGRGKRPAGRKLDPLKSFNANRRK
ncbi:MAG: hypothetical protein LQ350_002154 [Teloschistes chrysophthalmus]|nr:MAG: hypothetical protein LQ350_002154 [Niorma chrysophthalma]